MNSRGCNSQEQKQSNKTSHTSSSGQTLKSSAYDHGFEQKCIDHGIYMPSQRNKPENWQELQNTLVHPRLPLSPSNFSDSAFERFCKAEAEARDKIDVIVDALPTILGEKQRNYPSAGNVPFRNVDDMAPDVFKKPKPDFYWGAQPKQIDQQIRQDINHQIIPSIEETCPAAPNLFLKVEGPDRPAAKKTVQACYVGGMGARAMHALQCYGQAEPTYDNKAYTYSFTSYDGALKMYAHHPAQPLRPGESSQYYMSQLCSYALTLLRETSIPSDKELVPSGMLEILQESRETYS